MFAGCSRGLLMLFLSSNVSAFRFNSQNFSQPVHIVFIAMMLGNSFFDLMEKNITFVSLRKEFKMPFFKDTAADQ